MVRKFVEDMSRHVHKKFSKKKRVVLTQEEREHEVLRQNMKEQFKKLKDKGISIRTIST